MLDDPLPAWNDGPTKQAILDFVAAVTTAGGDQFVTEGDRIAVFDNDGTLWCEQPLYIQLGFALDRVRLGSRAPGMAEQPPFNAILANDCDALAGLTKRDLAALIAATTPG